jgi:hypothetical protein
VFRIWCTLKFGTKPDRLAAPSVKNQMNSAVRRVMEQNAAEDLTRLLRQRRSLNSWNTFLMYSFHLLQATGIMLSAYATSHNEAWIWVGLSLNFLATLTSIYEKQNSALSSLLLADIVDIKRGVYVDEGVVDRRDNQTPPAEQPHSPDHVI